ncbi:hypothetical protein J2W43_002559 [Pseudomonas brassicacearum]|uniref:Ricin B lectin domain-containing protein n=1 Tax=Pseudomonas brassicacearum TaxID=930166 RepID=A0AAW8MBH9_9PSED|nr:RICIN domain-containing protein [Pseudomonas brassicacearum]MDR6958577.1 hypothetical protein [Pseudomonas brassicacearum]
MKDTSNLSNTISERSPIPIIVPDGVYKIYSHIRTHPIRHLVVDMALVEDSDGVHNVKLFHDNDEPESTWRFFRHPDTALYEISNGINNSLFLGRSEGNGNNAITSPQETGSGWRRWQWYLKNAGDGVVAIENHSNQYVLDVAGSHTADNTNIILYPYQGSDNQKFRLLKLRDL